MATLLTIAILLADRFVLTPIETRRQAMDLNMQKAVSGLRSARTLFSQKKELLPVWQGMIESGLTGGVSEAESQVLHAVRNWSQESGLVLVSLRPESVTDVGELEELSFQASGTGSMAAVVGFLWRLEDSALPIKVTEMQLGSRKEGTDDLSLQIRISSVCRTGETAAAAPTPAVVTTEEEEGL